MNRLLAGLTLLLPFLLNAAPSGNQFIGWGRFGKFKQTTNTAGEVEWLSPKTACRPANEFIPSWNADLAPDGWLRVELRAFHGNEPTKFYDLGHWSRDAALHPRESVKGQKDADGDVDTDTLQLSTPADAFQFKLILGPASNAARLKLVTVSATDTRITAPPRKSLRSVWGKPPLPVPQRSQCAWTEGVSKWCSPTTTSMLLAFWSEKLNRPELDFDVPDIARAIHDTTWNGTGNWAFNMAFAGAQPGMRGIVTRFDDVRELEEWIASGNPVGISLCSNRLRGKDTPTSGHLVVCVGFAADGSVILNNPGSLHDTQKTYSRERFIHSWAYSKNTVYLVYPEGAKLPRDKFGHWTMERNTH